MLALNNIINNVLTYNDEFFIIILFYSFLNLVFSLIFLELLWPTHFFNQRFQNIFKKLNLRSYTSSILKIYKFSGFNTNSFFYKNFLN